MAPPPPEPADAPSSADRPALRAPTTLEWEEQRPLITDLWERKFTRKEIKDEMAKLGYAVTERMVLTRIHNWKLDRNSKEGEMAAAARQLLARQAAGKSSVVVIRNRRLEEAKLRRYAKRKATTLEDLARLARETTPETVVVRSPSPEPIKRSSSPRNVSPPDVYAVPEKLFKEIETYTLSRVAVLNGLLTDFVIGWDAAFIRALEDAQELLLRWRRSNSFRDLTRAKHCIERALDQFPSKMPEAGMGFLMRLTLIIHEYIMNGFVDAARVILRCLYSCSSELSRLREYCSLFRAYVLAINHNSFTQMAGTVLGLICQTIEANTIEENTPHSLPTVPQNRLIPALSWNRVDDSTLIISIDSPDLPGKRVSGSLHSPTLISHARGSFGGRSFTGSSGRAAGQLAVA